MRWEELLQQKRVEERATDPDEIRDLRAAMQRQLANAAVPGLTPDGRLQHVFSAVRQAATVAIRAEGFRTRGRAHHETTFLALETIGAPLADHAAGCQMLRYKRIAVEYSGEDVTEDEASDALEKATAFVQNLEAWLTERHSELAS